MSNECRQVRIAIGGEPHDLSPEVHAHLTACAGCRQFHAETVALDGRVRAALELPLAKFRNASPRPARRLALAASVMLAMLVAGGSWLLWPQPALAREVLEHVSHEPGSWGSHVVLDASALAGVLQKAGVQFDTSMPVVYAQPCTFRGRISPHLVVQTANGPMTVMLLAHEKVAARQEFSEGGYRGILLPAGEGSIAVLMQNAQVPEAVATQVISGVRW
jgi:hypothetical protein